MIIQILVDNPSSWIVPHARELAVQLTRQGHEATIRHDADSVVAGDILCMLACEKIFRDLHLNKHNLVIHESDLPQGKGWSPLTWQILEGKNQIPVTLFEAVASVDAGPIYSQSVIVLEGHELLPEIKHLQGVVSQQLILNFVRDYPNNPSRPQTGESTFYTRRGPDHSQLAMHKTLADQFNLLRVCDNERYPAFFIKDGKKYILKIEKG